MLSLGRFPIRCGLLLDLECGRLTAPPCPVPAIAGRTRRSATLSQNDQQLLVPGMKAVLEQPSPGRLARQSLGRRNIVLLHEQRAKREPESVGSVLHSHCRNRPCRYKISTSQLLREFANVQPNPSLAASGSPVLPCTDDCNCCRHSGRLTRLLRRKQTRLRLLPEHQHRARQGWQIAAHHRPH